MAYGSLAGIKEWLPEVSGSTYDTELASIQSVVSNRIKMRLRNYTDPENLPADWVNELADIENQWAAGVFRARRQRDNREYAEEAGKRLEEFIDAHFKTGFFKTGLKAFRALVGRGERGRVTKFG